MMLPVLSQLNHPEIFEINTIFCNNLAGQGAHDRNDGNDSQPSMDNIENEFSSCHQLFAAHIDYNYILIDQHAD